MDERMVRSVEARRFEWTHAARWAALALALAGALALALAIAMTPGFALAQDSPAPPDSVTDAPADSAQAADETFFPTVRLPEPQVSRERPGPNDRPAVTRMVRFAYRNRNVVRSGPGDHFAIAGVFPRGRSFPVIAKSGDWYNVRVSDFETGWVHASLCKEFDDLSGLEFRPNPRLYSRTGGYVLGGVAGAYAFDRKSNSLLLGGKLGYYVFDRVQVEAGVAWTHVRRPAEIVETLFGLSLEAEDFHMLFYDLNLVVEVLPGRQMVPYVCGGVGSSIMLGRTEASFNFGAGTALFFSKRTAMRWEVRDYRFQSGSDDARLNNDNIAFTLSTAMLF